MATYEATVEIDAPPKRVWERLAAVDRWPQWLPTVTKVDALDGPSLRLGARFRLAQPKLRPTVWTVTELQPPLRFEWRARSPGIEMVADHVLERIATGATHARLGFEFGGWLGRLLAAAYGSIARAYLEQEAEALKRSAEGHRAPSPPDGIVKPEDTSSCTSTE